MSSMSPNTAPCNRGIGYTYAGRAAGAPAVTPAAHYSFGLDFPALAQLLEPVASGLVGGAIAGAFAISLYMANKWSTARGEEFSRASALCVELDYIRKMLPDASLGRFTPSPTHYLGMIKETDSGHSDLGRPTPSPRIAPPGILGSAYRGLVNSGGISVFEASLQERLYGFYDRLEKGDYNMVYEQVLPMMDAAARFRDANAPLAPRARMRRANERILASLWQRRQRGSMRKI